MRSGTRAGAGDRRPGLALLIATLALAGAAARAGAAEPDPSGPSVCAPPCPEGQSCVGSTCVPAGSRTAPPPAPTAAPQPAAADATPPQTGAPLSSPPAASPSRPQAGQPPSQASPYPPGPGDAPTPPGPGPYPPPPGISSPPPGLSLPPRSPPMRKRHLFALPYLGVHSYRHSEATNYDPGARLGGLIGIRFNDIVSIDAELSFNLSNVHDLPPTMTNFSEWGVDYAFTMMFQFPAGRAELVLGPKAGRFIVETSLRESGTKIDQEVTGFLAGLNAGLFIPATPRTSLGVLLSYEFWWAVHACRSAAGDSDACSSVHDAPTVKVLGLTAAALF